MKVRKTHIYLVLFLALLGCEDYYVPEIDLAPNSLVVEAILTDKREPLTIKLSRTIPFTDRTYFQGEKDAIIVLKSDNEERYTFNEYARGYYISDDTIQASPGVRYQLHVKTDDGEKYNSDYEVMMEPTGIEDVQFLDTVREEVNYNYWDEPYVKLYDGINIAVKPEKPIDSDVGFLYKWNSLINYYVLSTQLPNEYNYYCWKKMFSNTIYIYDHNDEETNNTLVFDDLHFLSYYNLDPSTVDSARFEGTIYTKYSTGFYYLIEQYTITQDGADFWKSVKRQSEASGKLFDPLEEEITTNIQCTTNPDLRCFGYFNTAAYSKRVIKVDLGTKDIVGYEDVDFLPSPEEHEDCWLGGAPDFWSF
ncbi:MAG: DUF4249 domain-containing protein [Prolixibacteraceae bacterium]|jgi:hypothetical protein|nr:DUF4249 domain-containing protein [Prolixibacteraceae bacterium]